MRRNVAKQLHGKLEWECKCVRTWCLFTISIEVNKACSIL